MSKKTLAFLFTRQQVKKVCPINLIPAYRRQPYEGAKKPYSYLEWKIYIYISEVVSVTIYTYIFTRALGVGKTNKKKRVKKPKYHE